MKPIVIKYGGSLLEDPAHRSKFLADIAQISKTQKIVLVHGGGKEISKALEASGLPVKFVNGRRYTDDATMSVVDRVLSEINRDIVGQLVALGAKAAGFSGKTEEMIIGRTLPELGRVGQPQLVSQEILESIIEKTPLPVFYSVAVDSGGHLININADDFALAISVALYARRLVYLTDSGGILDSKGKLISLISAPEIDDMVSDGVITGGMVVKAQSCVEALKRGVNRVDICKGIGFLLDQDVELDGTSFIPDVSRNN